MMLFNDIGFFIVNKSNFFNLEKRLRVDNIDSNYINDLRLILTDKLISDDLYSLNSSISSILDIFSYDKETALYEIQNGDKKTILLYYLYSIGKGIVEDYFYFRSPLYLSETNFRKNDVFQKIYNGNILSVNEFEIKNGSYYLIPNEIDVKKIIQSISEIYQKNPDEININLLYNELKKFEEEDDFLIIQKYY